MPGPPPPPPPMMSGGPPPPPIANFNNVKKSSGNSSSGANDRNALLSQIQKGTKLKKVTTVDKSGPIVSGRIAGATDSKGSSPQKSYGSSSVKSSPDSATSSPVRTGGFMSIQDELQAKLTMKKNKNSPDKGSKSIVETKESSPPSTTAPSKLIMNEIRSKQSVISPQHQFQKSSTPTPIVNDAIPNRSSLFNNNNSNNNNNNNSSSNNNNINNISKNIINNSSYDNKSQPSAPPKINHGKPNLAPKPPPQLSLAMNNNSSSNSSLNESNRKAVARHQSMKSPRSPPVVPPMGPFSSDNHFGTMRNPTSQNRAQEPLNLQPVQKPVTQRPTNRPPPPPVPNRNIATNLSQTPHAKSTTALNTSINNSRDQNLSGPKPTISSSGSSNNISSMDALDSSHGPPLPPHRFSSQHKAPQQPLTSNQTPPEVPKRTSSNRTSMETRSFHNSSNKLVVDLEARYSLLFHSMSELPPPKPFLNVSKSYPSKAVRPNGI